MFTPDDLPFSQEEADKELEDLKNVKDDRIKPIIKLSNLKGVFDVDNSDEHTMIFNERSYTYEQFILMLKAMYRGLYLYIDNVDYEQYPDEDPVESYILSNAFRVLDNNSDNAFVYASTSMEEVEELIRKYKTGTVNNGAIIFNQFNSENVESLARIIDNDDIYWKDVTAFRPNILGLQCRTEEITYIEYVIENMYSSVSKTICDSCGKIGHKVTDMSVHRTNDPDKKSSNVQCCSSCAKSTKTNPAEADMSVGRNDPCICGSGKKYKKCCLIK